MVILCCMVAGKVGAGVFSIEIDASESVGRLKELIKAKQSKTYKDVDAEELHVSLAKRNGTWLPSNDPGLSYMRCLYIPATVEKLLDEELSSDKRIGDVLVPNPQDGELHVLVQSGYTLQTLVKDLEWREPLRFCSGTGKDWPYQETSEVATTFTDSLIRHYNAWKADNHDKQMHAINVVAGGPGTGKSRMLEEMKGILCEAAVLSKNQELEERMKRAYQVNITFGDETPAAGALINSEIPGYDISYRMLYQLAKEREDWAAFCGKLDRLYGNITLSIGVVIRMLAKLTKTENVEDMTVILCLDGLENLGNDGTMSCEFYCIMTSLCCVKNASRAFVVCACPEPVGRSPALSGQLKEYLVPPVLRGDQVLKPRTRVERQLVDDMGGVGRGLEILDGVLCKYTREELEETDPVTRYDEIFGALELQYEDFFRSDFFQSSSNCRQVLAAVLSRRSCYSYGFIGCTGITVRWLLQSCGLFRLNDERHLDCPFIVLPMLIREIIKRQSHVNNSDEYLARFVLGWQGFEQVVAFQRWVKSFAYCDQPVRLSTLHAGARFGEVEHIYITERNTRKVVDAADRAGDHAMETIVVNRVSTDTSGGGVSMRVSLKDHGRPVECNEVIRCSKRQKLSGSVYAQEKAEAKPHDSDVFLLVTPAEATNFTLPPRCGIVSQSEFAQYFGPFGSRAYRSLWEAPNLNTASYHELRRIEGVGDATAKKIVDERQLRLFSSIDDALKRLFPDGNTESGRILRAMRCDAGYGRSSHISSK